MDGSVHDQLDDKSLKRVGETVRTVVILVSVLMSPIVLIGCADSTEQRLRQVQKELEQVFETELLDGDITIQRAGDHLTLVITERLLFDAGSHEIKPDGIEVLKHMGALFETAPLKEIRVAGHGDMDSPSDRSSKYFEKLALCRARAAQTVRVLKENGLDSQNVILEWYGDIRPIASNETEEGRKMNRRIEVLLYAKRA